MTSKLFAKTGGFPEGKSSMVVVWIIFGTLVRQINARSANRVRPREVPRIGAMELAQRA